MDGLMEGKSVVVTGAGRGIGLAIAQLMASEGASVVINDLGVSLTGDKEGDDPASEAAAEIRASGGQAIANGESVASWESAERIVGAALEAFGRIDAVVNCAGIIRDRMFHRMEPSDWSDVIDVHLNGTFYMSRAAAPHFREQGSGAYVHITSNSGLIGALGQASYAAAKAGIVGLSRSIAIDMAKFNVRSNCLSPAAYSRMVASMSGDDNSQLVEAAKASMSPEQIAPLAVLLASDAAASITGQILGARGNEMYLFNQSRPIRTLHRGDGWTPQALADQLVPAWQSSFTPLERGRDVFPWDPI
ncbi:MAG: 3-hydroxyacyl-CoA dehydrogenase [Actinomycetia bacterium]|nr:3-hydroxyacyl-CoA dehydrogenase [Actinomycetes bacterium]